MSSSSLSSLPESGACTPPPKPVHLKFSPIGKVPPYYIQHKRDQVQAFEKHVQDLGSLSREDFLKCLHGSSSDDLLPSQIPKLPNDHFSIDGFVDLANSIAESLGKSIDATCDNLLSFKYMEHKTPCGHVTGTKCRPDITAAFEKDWKFSTEDGHPNWALIQLAGEKASKGKSLTTQKKNAATYLHYLLLARPDFLVAQGLLTTESGVVFLVGIGGVGIQEHTVEWEDEEDLYKLLYAFIYRLYCPSHFADPSYTRTEFDEETREVIYTVHTKEMDYPGFRPIHARTPFETRTHVLSNPSSNVMQEVNNGPLTVVKDQLCRIGRRFDEKTILSKIHRLERVPGVVEAVVGEVADVPLSPGRKKHRLGLRQRGSPFTSIPTAKKVLETLFDVLEVLRCLRMERKILHRDISVGNVMYIENPEIREKNTVELSFAKYLLGESKVRQETSLLLVDFNLGEDMEDKKDKDHIERTGTPIFISRAVERGAPVPLPTSVISILREAPRSPECYAKAHPERISDFQAKEILVDSRKVDQSQNEGWRHELDHDVESVFWLLLYWAMVAQPKGRRGENIDSNSWTGLLGDVEARERLVRMFSSGNSPKNLTHSDYAPLWPLISDLAAILEVDKQWVPKLDVRQRPEYICEAFQRLILQFIISNRDKRFMTCRVDKSLRSVQAVAQSGALSITPSEQRDGSDRAKRPRLDRTEDESRGDSSQMIL